MTLGGQTTNEANKAKKLLSDLDDIDKKIKENEEILSMNNVDMNTPLVDAEGFPSATIDVYSVRKARYEIICLRNDRAKLMEEMSKALADLHTKSSPHTDFNKSPAVHRTSNDPFIKIDSVENGSPADLAKLRENDLVIQFGTLYAGNFQGFDQLKAYVQNAINMTIKVTVFRPQSETSSHVYRLELKPKVWGGNGIIGCSFASINKK